LLLWHWALQSLEEPARYDEHRMIHIVGSELTSAAGFVSAMLSGLQAADIGFDKETYDCGSIASSIDSLQSPIIHLGISNTAPANHL
jgi:hypothetical protein